MNVTLDIPEDLYRQAQQMAAASKLSVEQVISSAFAEHVSAVQRLQAIASRGNREDFLRVLDKVPDADPDSRDRL